MCVYIYVRVHVHVQVPLHCTLHVSSVILPSGVAYLSAWRNVWICFHLLGTMMKGVMQIMR